jgi:hypothetical protein
MKLNLKATFATLTICDTQHTGKHYNTVSSAVVLSVVMLNATMLRAVVPHLGWLQPYLQILD